MLAPLKVARGLPVRPRLRHRRRRSSTIANAVTRRFVETSDNCDLEVLESKASPSSPSSPSLSNKPPLLFVHGSGHAAWCWAEHFMPYASSRGFDSVALSLRGRGKSGAPPPGAKAGGTLESHAEDVAAVAEMLVGEGMRPPIVVGHSFGGMVVEKLALREREREEREKEKREKETTSAAGSPSAPASGSGSASSLHSASSSASSLLSGIALLNSVPPSGNAAMIGRIAKDRGLWVSAKLTYGFITRAYAKDPALCRLMFFSDELAESEVERFVRLLRENDGETPVLDVRELPKQVPLPALISNPSSSSSSSPSSSLSSAAPWPAFVLGGRDDAIVDERACLESAEWLGISADSTESEKANTESEKASRSRQLVMVEGLAHDCMLDARWREAADALLGWAGGV